jgi:hypothetical protein
MDIYVGKVVVAGSITAKVQHSSAYNLWTDAKTVSITASTDKTVTAVSTSTDALISSSGEVPAGLQPNTVYRVTVVDSNTIKLTNTAGSVNLTSTGSGTILVTPVRAFSIIHQEVVAGDQAHTPMKSKGRVTMSLTNAGDSVQVIDCISLMG